MKTRTKTMALALAALMILTAAAATTALAAPGDGHTGGVYDLSADGVTLVPLRADKTEAEGISGELTDGVKTVYADAVRFKLTFAGEDGEQYAVFILKGGEEVPTEKNIRYVNQYSGAGTVECELYPSEMDEGEYSVYVSGGGEYKKAASFKVAGTWSEPELARGDVNGDGAVNSLDALLVLRISARLETPDADVSARADLDGSGTIDSIDALEVLNISAKLD